MKVLLIDNFSSFNYNLVEELEKKGCEVLVYRSDTDMNIIDNELKSFKPKLLVIGSGSSINASKLSVQVIDRYQAKIPLFAVGLGNECIIEAFGGKVGKAPDVFFGKQVKVQHDGKTIYKDMDKTFNAAVYHHLVAVQMPYSVEVSARSDTGIVMGVRHKEHFIEGVQFDPGSILTPLGAKLIQNVINEVKKL